MNSFQIKIYFLALSAFYRMGFKVSAHKLADFWMDSRYHNLVVAAESFDESHQDFPRCLSCKRQTIPGYPHHDCQWLQRYVGKAITSMASEVRKHGPRCNYPTGCSEPAEDNGFCEIHNCGGPAA